MIEPPQVVQAEAQPAAVIRLTIPRDEMQHVMGPGLAEVFAAVQAQGAEPAGPWFTHHLQMDPETFDFEIGVPVKTPVVAAGRVQPGGLPGARVARTVYQGGPEGLGEAWGEFGAWIDAAGHTAAPDLWEQYIVGPESGPDPANWRTVLNRPLVESK